MPYDPFELSTPSTPLLNRAASVAAGPFVSGLLGLKSCHQLYREAGRMTDAPFVTRALAALRIRPRCAHHDLAAIPATGGLIVAANHPHGAADGLVLASLLQQVRPDVRILTNYLLWRIPELRDVCFFVDPFGGPNASVRSRSGLRAAHQWLRDGGALIVFPAGEVAHTRQGDGSYADSPWNESVGRFALATGARVVPAFIAGRNSAVFYAAGRVHRALRTLLLARELLNTRGRSIHVSFGRALAASQLAAHSRGASTATRRIRAAVERLDDVAADVASLPRECCLVRHEAFEVYRAEASQIPAALREIGRLREVTFRAAGEGTGNHVDLDAFDEHYVHLFTWDRIRHRIVGAYRIGRTDQIVRARGFSGLYTRSLFEFDERLLMRIAPALELGRSFVRAEYQKSYSALLLLWKGVARFVSLHPQYRVLFGPVSISARYSEMSQRLLIAFLEQHHCDEQLAELVKRTKRASAPSGRVAGVPGSIEALDRLLARTERDGTGVPVLLRQYLKLNARLIGFNIDPKFSGVLDALMLVDLTKVDVRILSRYFGAAEAAAFLARHAANAA